MHPRVIPIIVAMLTMAGPFTIDTYLPAFPSIEADYQISRAALSQSLGIYLAAFGFSTLIWGPLSDRIGRKPVIMASMALYALASAGCGMAPSFTLFLLFRIVEGVAASGGMVVGRAMIRDYFDARQSQRVMAQVMMLFAIAPAIAPVIGNALHGAFGWRSIFFFLAAYGVLTVVMVGWMVEETLPDNQRQSIHPRHVATIYRTAFSDRNFLLLTLIIAAAFAGFFLYIVGAPTVVFDFLHLGNNGIPRMFIPLVSGVMLGSWLAARLAQRWSQRRTVQFGLSILVTATLLNLIQGYWIVPPQPLYAIAPVVLYAFGIAILMPVLTVMSLDCFPHNKGAASAAQGCMQMGINAAVASIAAPLLSAALFHFVLAQAVSLLVALLLWRRIQSDPGRVVAPA